MPVFVAALYFLDGNLGRWTALGIFTVESISDSLDGHLARGWQQYCGFGGMLDPIADYLVFAAAVGVGVAAD